MLEPHHRQQRLQQGHWPLARSALLPAPQPQRPCERGEKVDLLSHASRQSDSLSIGCNAVVAPRGGASLAGSSLLTSRAASEAPSYLTAPKPMLGGRRTEPGITGGCPPTKRPSSWLMSSGVGGVTRELPSGGGNTNAAIEAPAAAAAAAAASQYRYTWQTSKENTQATTEYAASVLQAEILLRGFERYRRSVSASPLTHTLSRPTLQPDSREAGGGGGVDSKMQLSFAVEALGPHCAPSVITPHRGCEGLGNARNATAAQLPRASRSPLLAPQLDPEAFELAKRRALQVLCCNAHARTAYVVQGLRLSRAVYDDVLGRPVEATERVVALESAPSRRTTTVTPLSDGPPAPPRVTADAAPRVSHFSASPLLGRDSERKENQSPVAADAVGTAAAAAASMPLMSEAERVAATAEAERALSLLSTIRAMRRQTEELTVSLLHACGEWGCWSTPPVNVDHAPDMTQGLSCASQVQPRDAKPEQHLFADLFLEGPVISTGLSLSPSASLLGLREESPTAYLAALRATGAVGDAVVALDTTRYSPVNTFAEESASRRGRACRVLRQALERQRQQCSLSTATAGAAFLDMALTPPQSALPPPPPTSVQLDIYAAHQRALRGAISQGGGGEEAAQTVLACSTKTSGTAPSGGVATPYASLQKKLEALSTQRRQLQHTYDVLYAAAVEGQVTSTDLHPDSHRKVQVGKAIPPTFPANADAGTLVSAVPHTAEAPAGAPQEFETPLPSLFRPLAAVPDALHSAPCSSPPKHSSNDPSRGYQALALSDEIQSTSLIERAVDHTRPWEEPSTILEEEEEEEGAAPPPRRRGADFSHSATTTTPVDGDTPEAEASPSGQQTSHSPPRGEGSRPGKDKPVLMEYREVQVRAGSVDGLDAATDISQIRSHQVTNMLRPPLSSASSSGTVDARGGVVGGRPEACEASWQPYTNAALSTHPDAAHAVVVAEEQRRAARHREKCKGRGSHSADNTAVVKMDDAVRHHLTQWISKQQRHTGYEGAVVSSSSPFLTQEELSVAAAWLRATSSPSIVRKATNAPPPAAVVRVLNHVFPYSVGPASYNVANKSPIASAPSKTSDSNGGEERQASRYRQQQPPLVSTSSITPSRHSSSGASPQLQAASFGVQSLPRADSADTSVYDLPTSSPEWSGEVSDGDFKAPAAPLVLPAPALAHPRVVPKSIPPPPLSPRSRGTDGGGSAVLQKPLKHKRRRGIFSRLFSCIG